MVESEGQFITVGLFESIGISVNKSHPDIYIFPLHTHVEKSYLY